MDKMIAIDDKNDDLLRKNLFFFQIQNHLPRSLCFLKLKQWQHSVNTATRAIQGDKDPADPLENVLPPEKKAKALFRRALAQKDAG
jgi:hypothetical protein